MRSFVADRLAFAGLLAAGLALTGCQSVTTTKDQGVEYAEANEVMAAEIQERIAEIPYQQRDELLDNLFWLRQRGEEAIPFLLDGLHDQNPKVRSNSSWVLGQIHDRRTIPDLVPLMKDEHESVRLEAARSLVAMGDLSASPMLIEGLDSDKVQVRYLCHEALRRSTLQDFDYDHLGSDPVARSQSVYRWREWWSETSGDQFFAASYAQEKGLETGEGTEILGPGVGQPATPGVETAPPWENETMPGSTPAGSAAPIGSGTVEGTTGGGEQGTDSIPTGSSGN